MANRLVDNVIIVDSSMGNLPVVGGISANLTAFNISAFSFWAADSSGSCVFSGGNTADTIWKTSFIAVAGSGIFQATQSITFSRPLTMSSVKVPVFTSGTGYIYLA